MKHLFYAILLFLAISSCISPYDFSLEDNPAFLLVDGQIYDKDSSVVRLYYTNQKNNDPTNIKITDAKIQVIENGNKRINFVFNSIAQEYKPDDLKFRGCKGCTYQLNVVLPNGQEYISSIDTLLVPDKYTQIFDIYKSGESKFEVYGNLQPKTNESKYYQAYFVTYERASACADCGYSYNYEVMPGLPCPGFLKNCLTSPQVLNTFNGANVPFIFSFPCLPGKPTCWNFKKLRYSSIFGDNILGIGSKRTQKLLEVPLSAYVRYYIEVYQNNISAEAYKYMRTLEETGQRTGSLADPIPPLITGNVFLKKDENQRVLGFFQVSGQQKYGYNVERGNAPAGERVVENNPELIYSDVRYGTVTAAPPNEKLGCKFTPYADCRPTSFRTNIMPLNWRD
jgi:hypothetical protein